MVFLNEGFLLRDAEEKIAIARRVLAKARATCAGAIESAQLCSWADRLSEAEKASPGIARASAVDLTAEINRRLTRRDVREARVEAKRARGRAKSARHSANKAEKAEENRRMAKLFGCGMKSSR